MRRHGLVANGKDPEGFRWVKREECRRVWGAGRGGSLTDARALVHRAEGARRRWPQATTPRQTDILDLLEAGPLSTRRIARAVGRHCFAGSDLGLAVYDDELEPLQFHCPHFGRNSHSFSAFNWTPIFPLF